MKNPEKSSKQYYWFEDEEVYIDKNHNIIKKRNNTKKLINDILHLERWDSTRKNIYKINGNKVYFKKMGPDQKNINHFKEVYQEKRINILRIIKEQINETDIDFFVGVYYIGYSKLVLSIIHSEFYYQDNRKEVTFKFLLDDIVNSIKPSHNLVKNIDGQNKGEKILFTNSTNFLNVFEKISTFKGTLSFFEKESFKKDNLMKIVSSIKDKNSQKLVSLSNEQKVRNPKLQKAFRNELKNEVKGNYIDMLHLISKYQDKKDINNKLIIASHIKDFSSSNVEEASDRNNGLLLPTYIDVFFDKKLLSFDDNGKSILSNSLKDILNKELLLKLENLQINDLYLNNKRKNYLKWHRENLIK